MPNPPNNEIAGEPLKDEVHTPKGTLLKRAREAQGLSLESIHEATKIPLDALRGIEEGYTVRTLSKFYYRGFLKMYAQYLNMDLKEILGEEQKPVLPKYTRPTKEPSWDFDQWVTRFFTKERKQLLLKGSGIVLSIFIAWKVTAFVVTRWPKPVKKEIVKKQDPKIEKPKKAVTEESKKAASAKPAEAKAVTAALATTATAAAHSQLLSNISLTARARKNSWLNVRADGHTVFQGALSVGSVETWAANDKIEISGKNLNQLEFELNGKMIGTLGRADLKAKTIIITKDGLKVVK